MGEGPVADEAECGAGDVAVGNGGRKGDCNKSVDEKKKGKDDVAARNGGRKGDFDNGVDEKMTTGRAGFPRRPTAGASELFSRRPMAVALKGNSTRASGTSTHQDPRV